MLPVALQQLPLEERAEGIAIDEEDAEELSELMEFQHLLRTNQDRQRQQLLERREWEYFQVAMDLPVEVREEEEARIREDEVGIEVEEVALPVGSVRCLHRME